VDFKKEIEEKFAKSKLRSFKFPLKKMVPKLPDPMRSSRYVEGESSFNSGRRGLNQSSFVSY
jgi:hypothetical protein